MSTEKKVDLCEISDPQLTAHPEVSIIILVYNHENYLAVTLTSVLTQLVGVSCEVLIGEDCSTDRSREIALEFLKHYPKSVRIITSDQNVGAFENARRLLNATRGKFIASLDGDDYWLPEKLKKQLSYMHDNPDCVAVYTNAVAIDAQGNQIGLFNDARTTQFSLGTLLKRGNFLNSSSLFYRAELKSSLKNMRDKMLDFAVHLFIARHGRFGHLGEPLVAYRVNSGGSMIANDNARVRELYWQAIQSVPRELVSNDDYAHGIADFLRRVFFRAVRTRDLALFRTWCMRVYPASPYGTARTSALVIASIVRIGWKMLWAQTAWLTGRRPTRILYRC